ncbi:dynein regulation protein LC7 [Streptomyces sp. Ru73]|uniref:roadblock/LC7 domain-containing protein n=1 Tax=Streptomyces sp. Ru73 TaxID=2080748 RepID=UPI000CDCFEAE|nr:roadblock/LC7 domain-containing protein [Streptomyces sp. Ru73]POX43024.1 dynein regulation protein LC7 [Streptomyces sp. Ru73]
MTNDVMPQNGRDWLLEGFLARVPGATGVLWATCDGLKLASAGLTTDMADTMAALVSGMHSLSKNLGVLAGVSDGGVRQINIEHDGANLFVMSAGNLPEGTAVQLSPDIREVGTVLGVMAGHDADPSLVGYEMGALVTSVDEHLVTAVRRAASGDGQ